MQFLYRYMQFLTVNFCPYAAIVKGMLEHESVSSPAAFTATTAAPVKLKTDSLIATYSAQKAPATTREPAGGLAMSIPRSGKGKDCHACKGVNETRIRVNDT